MEKTKWSENVILVDADYVDAVAFNLIVNFERMLNRPIPKADLAQWLVCAALDGGVGEGKNDIQVVFIHGKGEGVLRKAVLDELKRKYKNCEAQDASFREYGFGATLVTVH